MGDARPRCHANEKEAERDLAQALRMLGFDVVHLSQPRASMQTEGTPDFYLRHPQRGFRFWLEAKRLERRGGMVVRTRPSQRQHAWGTVETAAGGVYVVAACVSDLVASLAQAGFAVPSAHLVPLAALSAGDPSPPEVWTPPMTVEMARAVLSGAVRPPRTFHPTKEKR